MRQHLRQLSALLAALLPYSTYILDQFVLARLKLQGINECACLNRAGIEEELMCGYGEQWLCQLADFRHEKVVDVLTCNEDGGVFLSDSLHCITDILNTL